MDTNQGPVAIGGVGGSGTRFFASALAELGFYLGADLNSAFDNLWFTLLFKRKSLWPAEQHIDEISKLVAIFTRLMTRSLQADDEVLSILNECVREVTDEHPMDWRTARYRSMMEVAQATGVRIKEPRWGWKEPNTHVLLPVLLQVVSGLKYIHVMRHGLDMAFSRNQNQLALWGELYLGREVDSSSPVDSLSYWCEVHRRIRALSLAGPDRLLLLNYDELCRQPDRELSRLLEFIGLPDVDRDVIDALAGGLVAGESGRYRAHDLSMFHQQDLEFVASLGFTI